METTMVRYNEIPENVQKKLRIDKDSMPKKGESVIFSITRIPRKVKNVKGDDVNVYPASIGIANKSILYYDNETYPIAYITSTSPDGTHVFGEPEFMGSEGGTIVISGTEENRFGLLRYLRSHSANASNPLRNTSVEVIFSELKPVEDAQTRTRKKKERVRVEGSVLDLSNAEAITFLHALNLPTYKEKEQNIDALLDYVSTGQGMKKYMGLSSDVRTPIIALVKEAKRKEILSYDEDNREWGLVKTKGKILNVAPGLDEVEQLVDYMHNNTEGEDLKRFIENEIEGEAADKNRTASRKAIEGSN